MFFAEDPLNDFLISCFVIGVNWIIKNLVTILTEQAMAMEVAKESKSSSFL